MPRLADERRDRKITTLSRKIAGLCARSVTDTSVNGRHHEGVNGERLRPRKDVCYGFAPSGRPNDELVGDECKRRRLGFDGVFQERR